ncbi:hypothetical protein ACW185_09600 [Limosilactobacillus fermentum]
MSDLLLGSLGNGLATLLDIYFCVWCVISWHRLYVEVLTEEGYKPVSYVHRLRHI